MPTIATTAASQNPAASFKDPRLANVAKILEKKRTMDSDHKPVMGLGMSGSQLSLKSGGTAASNAPNTGEKIAIDKLKRAVMQGGTAAPIKPKVMTVKLKPSQIAFKSTEMKQVKKE